MKCVFYGVVGAYQNHCNESKFNHTSCVYVETPSAHLIFDAGTGLRTCENTNDLSSKPVVLFLSHFHYDHILGLLFFNQLHTQTNPLYIVHPFPDLAEQAVKSLFTPTFFPLPYSAVKRPPIFISPNDCNAFDIDVSFFKLFHPGDSFAYRVTFQEKSLVYATDNELTEENFLPTSSFFKDASLLIHDCYFFKENKSYVTNWGHSFLSSNLQLALAANISKLCLFHHHPALISKQSGSMQAEIDDFLKKNNHPFDCFLTYDNFSLDF